MAYTTINKSTDYFNTKLYTGNGGTNAITGVGFQPDWTWIKNRDDSYNHALFDAVRGVTKFLASNNSDAEQTNANELTAFGTDGFTSGNADRTNKNSDSFVSWNWKANGAGSANTDGSISSTVSANTTSGFSIVKYVGNGGSSGTVGHGLNAVPKMIITKVTSASGDNWKVYHVGSGNTKVLQLNVTDAEATSGAWYNTTPTSSVFSVGNDGATNGSGKTIIAYCFADIQGYSKFGSYTGNGNADGTFIYTGFKPQLVILKQTSGNTNWAMNDIKRQQYNAQDIILYADSNGAESGYGGNYFDILSNGFKQRMSGSYYNGSGLTYLYMAFAQAPLVGSNNVPCTAR